MWERAVAFSQIFFFFSASQGMKVNLARTTVVWSHRARLQKKISLFFHFMFWFFFPLLFLFGHPHVGPWKQPRTVFIIPLQKNTLSSFHSASPFSSLSSVTFVTYFCFTNFISLHFFFPPSCSHYPSHTFPQLQAQPLSAGHSHPNHKLLIPKIFLSRGQTITDQWPYIEYHVPQLISILYSSCTVTGLQLCFMNLKWWERTFDKIWCHAYMHRHSVLIEQKWQPSVSRHHNGLHMSLGHHTHSHTSTHTLIHRESWMSSGN